MEGVIQAWGKILSGYAPCLSIEITRECPLSCPGCYAYGVDHLGGEATLRDLVDARGEALIDGVLDLVRKHKPLHLSIVGGEPLVRYRELDRLLPQLAAMGIHTQLVTSAVRPIPRTWAPIPRLSIVVSVDGLQAEHDERRKPATYRRILENIAGHAITIHCTVTRQQVQREGYIEEFIKFWSERPEVRRIWVSFYTPQIGEVSPERLDQEDRAKAVSELLALCPRYPKLDMRRGMIESYSNPPRSPAECIFARVTTCISADLERAITPCQFGGNPDCASCGCIASAGLAAVARHRLPGGLRVGAIFEASLKVGAGVRRLRAARSRHAAKRRSAGERQSVAWG